MPTRTKRRRGYTRLSSKRQVTIPLGILRQTGLEAGDELKVEVDGSRIVLSPSLSLAEQRLAAIDMTAGSTPGVYEPGALERLRNEWR
jgi:AbrB family looped-hinge helix DNA binding protein